MRVQQRFARNLRTVFGCAVSLGLMIAFMFDWIQPATPKELSIGIALLCAWCFIHEYIFKEPR